MALKKLKTEFDETIVSRPVEEWIELAREYSQQLWDRQPASMPVELTACDYELVAQALTLWNTRHPQRTQFVEWGCGLATVAGIASLLGMQAAGIEASAFLCQHALRMQQRYQSQAELNLTFDIWRGNFLPEGSDTLATSEDPVVALRATERPVYAQVGVAIESFDLIFVYAWPGEEHFLKRVFDQFAARHTQLFLYLGPNHLELYEKQ